MPGREGAPAAGNSTIPVSNACNKQWTSPPLPSPPVDDAALEGPQIQDLGEIVPWLMKAAVRAGFCFHVRITVAEDAPDETRAALDRLLAEVSEKLKAELRAGTAPSTGERASTTPVHDRYSGSRSGRRRQKRSNRYWRQFDH